MLLAPLSGINCRFSTTLISFIGPFAHYTAIFLLVRLVVIVAFNGIVVPILLTLSLLSIGLITSIGICRHRVGVIKDILVASIKVTAQLLFLVFLTIN